MSLLSEIFCHTLYSFSTIFNCFQVISQALDSVPRAKPSRLVIGIAKAENH